jgi:predicted Zn-dependent protease
MLEDIILEGSALLSLSFSRKHEMQSDDYSYNLLKAAGGRTDGLITFFNRLEEELPMPEAGEWLMTHPLSNKRIENIQAKLEADGVSNEAIELKPEEALSDDAID